MNPKLNANDDGEE